MVFKPNYSSVYYIRVNSGRRTQPDGLITTVGYQTAQIEQHMHSTRMYTQMWTTMYGRYTRLCSRWMWGMPQSRVDAWWLCDNQRVPKLRIYTNYHTALMVGLKSLKPMEHFVGLFVVRHSSSVGSCPYGYGRHKQDALTKWENKRVASNEEGFSYLLELPRILLQIRGLAICLYVNACGPKRELRYGQSRARNGSTGPWPIQCKARGVHNGVGSARSATGK